MDYQSLKRVVLYNDHLYYDLGKPILKDSEYDELYDKLVEMEEHQGWRDPDSPTIRISAISGKIKHPHKLYSLKKVYEKSEVDAQFSIELPKIDGVNLSVTYTEGTINTLLTRGNGEFGQNVIHLSRVIEGIPVKVKNDFTYVGEVVTKSKDVENFRNYVAGALNLKSAKEAKDKKLFFIVHDVLGSTLDYLDRLKLAKTNGFTTIIDSDFKEFPQDGIVYRVATYEQEQALGYTSKYPRFAVALKTKESFSAVTYLTDIYWSVGRSGVVTPVGLVDTVELDDAKISRVILHNIDFIEQNNLGRGDMILIERRITPQFVKVLEHSNYPRFTIEDAASALNCEVYRDGPKLFVEAEAGYRLTEHYTKTLGIKGLGPASIRSLDITHPSMLYNRNDWETLGKNGLKIKEEIERPKDYTTLLAAFGIPSVGKSTAALITSNIPKFKDLRKISDMQIKGIGVVTVNNILSWLEDNEDWVLKLPYKLETEVSNIENPVVKKIAITGKLDMTKEQLAQHLSKFGYITSDTLTKDCYALITAGEESSKTRKAQQYGIPIVNYWNNRAVILKGMF